MPEILQIYELCAIGIFVYVTMVFLVSRHLGVRDDLADVAWGPGFVVIALLSLTSNAYSHKVSFVGILVTGLVYIWGIRLGLHIYSRFRRSTGDRRYIEARSKWQHFAWLRAYLTFFLFQGVLMLVIALPIVIVNAFNSNPGWNTYVGLIVWLIGFGFEVVGDAQLAKFVNSPANKGKIMTAGLWRYSRHPNYFGELTQWWGIGLIVVTAPYGWLGLAGPLVLSILIMKVSGVPTAEARLKTRPLWQAYANQTSRILPMPRRFKLKF